MKTEQEKGEEYLALLREFLTESNAIEGIHSETALTDAYAVWWWLIASHRKTLTVSNICKVQKGLTAHQLDLKSEWRGQLRTIPVTVGGNETLLWPFVRENLEVWVKQANKLQDPLADHIRFEKIHPFVDGNGRTGRILMNWQYQRMGQPLKIFTAVDRHETYYPLFK